MNTIRTFAGCCIVLISGVSVMGKVTPTGLRCEYLTDPLAIDVAQPRLSWMIEADGRGVRQTAYEILVACCERGLKGNEGSLWTTGKVASDATNQIVYAGKPLAPGQTAHWKVRVWTGGSEPSAWSQPARWRLGPSRPADWTAKWIGLPRPVPASEPLPALPATVLRKEFRLNQPIARALVTATALGAYELRINGKRVGEDLLTPNWTDYHTRVQYQTYDVTPLLRGGKNVVGATLGDGWYAGRLGISHIIPDGPLRGHYGRDLRLLVQLDVDFEDGDTATIITDGSWKATDDGPIRKSCLLDGEVYDARKEMPGWDAPGFDDSAWKPVIVQDAIKAQLNAQPNEPIRVTAELKPVAIKEPKPGVYVVDFGQEIAGWCRLTLRGPAGTTVTLRHAEVLQPDGMIYRDNLRMSVYANDKNLKWGPYLGARQEDQFILRGEGEEVFEPRFTYHGFRYVEVTGLPAKLSADQILARAFHSAPPMTGAFECSSPILNQLMSNITWTLRDNLHSVPTDCPQRDERMGWMGDMLAFAQSACFLMDMGGFFTKWVRDIRDDQADDGRYPDFAPQPYDANRSFSGVPAWGDCGVVVPWRMYVNYGDTRVLAEHFDSARRWVDWIHKNNPDLLWKNKRNNDYGDWLNGDTLKLEMFGYPKGGSEVPKETFATAFFQHSASLVAKMAAAIGRKDDAAKYGKLAADIRAAFIKAYIKDSGEVAGNAQASYAIALHFNLLPEDKRAEAARRAVERIKAYKDHISTGFHTTVMLMRELSGNGHNEVAYKLLNNRTIPSWLYEIDHGGTTIWERWDGYVEGRGFQDPGMNSFCHYAIGSVGEWMYRTILGINPDEEHPGYRHFILRPQPGGGLQWARGHYESIRGRIATDWRVQGDDLSLTVTIPANTTATVCLPAKAAVQVTEGGKPASEAEGVKFVRMADGAAIYEVGSGTYNFVSKGFAAK